MAEWIIQVRDDVGEPWRELEESAPRGLEGPYTTKREAQRALRGLRDVGMLNPYSASRVAERPSE